MTNSLTTALLVFGAVLTSVNGVAGTCVAGAGLALEAARFVLAGVSQDEFESL